MTTEKPKDPNWDAQEWSGEGHPAEGNKTARWGAGEWAGEAPDTGQEPAEGDSSISGGGHTPGEQHWVPEPKDQPADKKP